MITTVRYMAGVYRQALLKPAAATEGCLCFSEALKGSRNPHTSSSRSSRPPSRLGILRSIQISFRSPYATILAASAQKQEIHDCPSWTTSPAAGGRTIVERFLYLSDQWLDLWCA